MVQAAIELGPAWEIAKAIMLTVTTTAAVWTVRTVFTVRDQVRELIIEFRGVDGSNGVKSKVKSNEARIGAMEDRFVAMDAVDAAERADYQGEERRHLAVRHLADMIRKELESDGRGT